MNETPASQAVAKREPTAVEYIPHGAQDKIKLSVSIVQNLIAVKTKSGKTCSERDAIRFLAMCQAKRLNPFEGDCFLIGYDGKDGPTFSLVTGHQTYLKRAELHAEFDGMESGVIVLCDEGGLKDLPGDFYEEGQRVVGGWATVHFKTRKYPMTKRLRMSTFNKGFGQWNDNANGMIVKCAEADALRSAFPTMLGGLYLREELNLETPKPEFSKPIFASAGALDIKSGPAALPEPEPSPEPEPEPESEPAGGIVPNVTPPPAPNPEPVAPLKMLRVLLAGTKPKIKEADLLAYLSAVGATDGSLSSLEEVAMSTPSVITATAGNWPNVSAAINASKGGDK